VGLGTAITGGIMASALIASLIAGLRFRRYMPWLHCLTVGLVSVVGTQITDALTDGLGVSLYASTPIFAVSLAATFGARYWSERTLSMRTITAG
jgi:uncharacterized membrane-anchored protein